MRFVITYLLLNSASIIALLMAFHLATNDVRHWGWFLLASILLHTSYKVGNSDKKSLTKGEKDEM